MTLRVFLIINIIFILSSCSTLRDSRDVAVIRGYIQDKNGAGVEGVLIILKEFQKGNLWSMGFGEFYAVAETKTNEEGEFYFCEYLSDSFQLSYFYQGAWGGSLIYDTKPFQTIFERWNTAKSHSAASLNEDFFIESEREEIRSKKAVPAPQECSSVESKLKSH